MHPGRVVALHVAASHRAPMEARAEVTVEAGAGIVGDRYHGTRHRHLSVQSVADLAAAGQLLGRPIEPEETRRSVTVEGLVVPTTPGERLWLGDVELEVVRLAAPCRRMEESIGPGGREALRRRGGSVLRALGHGCVRVGDPVRVGEVDAGAGGWTGAGEPRAREPGVRAGRQSRDRVAGSS